MDLTEEFAWRGRRVRWAQVGSGPDVVFCHGTPWSSTLWSPYALALSREFTVHVWDMPGYGSSSKDPQHRVSLDVQGRLFADLLSYWDMPAPHVVAHDFGGAVALRAHLLHQSVFASLALVDVVALAPWGSDFFELVRANAAVFEALPSTIHESVLSEYIGGASHGGLTPGQLRVLTEPWLDREGQAAFYRQIAQADQVYTDEIQDRYGELDLPVLVVWGTEDTWIPVDRAHRLAHLIPGASLELIEDAGHLIQLDRPVQLAVTLHSWLSNLASGADT
jgi:pimeloyl-ACP methyl ester carboxylesterase